MDCFPWGINTGGAVDAASCFEEACSANLGDPPLGLRWESLGGEVIQMPGRKSVWDGPRFGVIAFREANRSNPWWTHEETLNTRSFTIELVTANLGFCRGLGTRT